MNTPAIPTRYEIYLQDLSKPYIDLTPVGYVHTIEEARTMCKALREADKEMCDRGVHTYLFKCSRIANEERVKECL